MALKHLAPNTVDKVSRDSTAVAARERAAKKSKKQKGEKDVVENNVAETNVVTSDLAGVDTRPSEALDSRAPGASCLTPDAPALFPSSEVLGNAGGSPCDNITPAAEESKPKRKCQLLIPTHVAAV